MHSLRFRLLVLWALSFAASVAVGVLLVQFYRQSTAAQVQRAEAVVARACDMIRDRYNAYVAGGGEPESPRPGTGSETSLNTVGSVALARELGVEGGVWQIGRGSLAYAFPSYEGSGPKTDVPAAELDRIRSVNQEAARAEQPVLSRSVSRTQTLLVFACPLSGAIPRLTAWTMTRVEAAPGYARLQLGVGVLFGLMVGMSAWLTLLMRSWSRSIGRIESALAQHSAETLPRIAPTGERELDRIVGALNEAGERLTEARRRSDELTARVSATERLAALGRVAAGVAHEIRNPIAAMRLKVENAIASDNERRRATLGSLVAQIDRLDRLVSELLAMTQRREVAVRDVDAPEFLRSCAADLSRSGGCAACDDHYQVRDRAYPVRPRPHAAGIGQLAAKRDSAHGGRWMCHVGGASGRGLAEITGERHRMWRCRRGQAQFVRALRDGSRGWYGSWFGNRPGIDAGPWRQGISPVSRRW